MKTRSFSLVILLLSIFLSSNLYASSPYSIQDAWLEGKLDNVADPTGVIQWSNVYGGHGTQTLTDPVFTKVDTVNNTSTSTYTAPSTGKTGLYVQSESYIGGHTYVETVSRYCDTFTFEAYNFFNPVHITLSMGMSYRFISPSIDYYSAKAGGVEIAVYFYNPITNTTKKIGVSHSENHTTGGWDTPGRGSMGISNDLGQYLQWYSGRTTDGFVYGDQVTLLFEYRTWAQHGAIVDAISTGDFKFLLSAADSNSYLRVTSTNGYYQVDGVPPTPTDVLSLIPGWNFISFPKVPPTADIPTVLADVSTNVKTVWGWDNQNQAWKRWKPAGGVSNTLASLEIGRGYWVYVDASGDINMDGWASPPSTTVSLAEAWNLIGYLGTDSTAAGTALNGILNKWNVAWSWDNGQWFGKHATIASLPLPIQPLANFNQGKAYWIKVKTGQATNWTQ